MGSFLDTAAIVALEKSLRGLSLRQQVISNNLANVNTPGFKASKVTFEDELQKVLAEDDADQHVLARTHPKHFGIEEPSLDAVQPQVHELERTTLRADGNNVDLEVELANLAETVIRYQASTAALSRKFALLRSIVVGGR